MEDNNQEQAVPKQFTMKEKVKFTMHDLNAIKERMLGVRRYWLISGLSSGLLIAGGILVKSRILAILGIVKIAGDVAEMVLSEQVIKDNSIRLQKMMKEQLGLYRDDVNKEELN